MKCFIWMLFPVVVSNFCEGQASTMLAEGKVTDARTHKGIVAFIHYSSIPTGGIYGKFKDSTFSFPVFGAARYQVTAEAAGYNSKTIILDPKDIDVNQRLYHDIRLTPAGQSIKLEHLIFSRGNASIDETSFRELDEIAQMMKENAAMVIQLEGHTDNRGTPSANMKLSRERVKAVKKYLVKSGIPKKRIRTKAFGGTRPLYTEMTPEAHKLNRRVEMRILKTH